MLTAVTEDTASVEFFLNTGEPLFKDFSKMKPTRSEKRDGSCSEVHFFLNEKEKVSQNLVLKEGQVILDQELIYTNL